MWSILSPHLKISHHELNRAWTHMRLARKTRVGFYFLCHPPPWCGPSSRLPRSTWVGKEAIGARQCSWEGRTGGGRGGADVGHHDCDGGEFGSGGWEAGGGGARAVGRDPHVAAKGRQGLGTPPGLRQRWQHIQGARPCVRHMQRGGTSRGRGDLVSIESPCSREHLSFPEFLPHCCGLFRIAFFSIEIQINDLA
jgi:hypothetical protein